MIPLLRRRSFATVPPLKVCSSSDESLPGRGGHARHENPRHASFHIPHGIARCRIQKRLQVAANLKLKQHTRDAQYGQLASRTKQLAHAQQAQKLRHRCQRPAVPRGMQEILLPPALHRPKARQRTCWRAGCMCVRVGMHESLSGGGVCSTARPGKPGQQQKARLRLKSPGPRFATVVLVPGTHGSHGATRIGAQTS